MDWDGFVAHHPAGHLLQTAGWAALKARFGWDSQLVTQEYGGELTAGAQVLYRFTPGRLFCVAYVPKGPVVDWERTGRARSVLQEVVTQARKRRAIFLRIEPGLLEEEVPTLSALMHEAGFWPVDRAIQPRRTILLDISGSEEEILARMKQKTRYNIRLAGRKGVKVRQGGPDEVSVFCSLAEATGERNRFGVHSPAYYQAAYALFAPNDQVGLLLAEFEGTPLAALMVFALGKTAWYLYGASGDEERRRMPAYLLQWEAIRWARARGCTQYDLWGVPDEDEETLEAEFAGRSDGLWGVYRFKRGFGGCLVRSAGAFDRVFNRPLYWLYRRVGESAYQGV